MKQIVHLILIFNLICLVGLVTYLRWWQLKHGKLTEKRIALILCGYFSFFVITTFSPLFRINFGVTMAIEIALLLVVWSIGYPWVRWLYKRFTSLR